MAFVVTSVMTKGNISDPDFDAWCSSVLDPNVVYAQFPDLTGIPISTIITDETSNNFSNPADGWISDEITVNADKSVWTGVSTWESQEYYLNAINKLNIANSLPETLGNISCTNSSPIVTGTSTNFLTAMQVGDTLTSKFDSSNVTVGVVASIESNTSLTLVENAAYSIADHRYDNENSSVEPTPYNFIMSLYNGTYILTTETTFANT